MERKLSLEALRGIACMLIVVVHCIQVDPVYGMYMSGCGKIGVWCFMVLSGLFLMLPLLEGKSFDYKDYYLKKLIRIYPIYILVLIIAAAIGYMPVKDMLMHVICLKGIGHFWYMPVIVKMYIIWPLFVLVYQKINNKRIFEILLILTAAAMSIAFPYRNYVENSISIRWYLPVFILGMLAAMIWDELKGKSFAKGNAAAVIFDILTVVLLASIVMKTAYFRQLLEGVEPSGYLQNKYLFIGAIWAVIVLGLLLNDHFDRALVKAKILHWLGKYSYAVYLIHYIILWKLNAMTGNTALKLVILVIASIIGAIIVTEIVKILQKNARNVKENIK